MVRSPQPFYRLLYDCLAHEQNSSGLVPAFCQPCRSLVPVVGLFFWEYFLVVVGQSHLQVMPTPQSIVWWHLPLQQPADVSAQVPAATQPHL